MNVKGIPELLTPASVFQSEPPDGDEYCRRSPWRYNPGILLRAMIRQYMATTGSTIILDNTGFTYSDSAPNMFTHVELTTECQRDRAM